MPIDQVFLHLTDATFFAGEVLAFFVLIATIISCFAPNRSTDRTVQKLLSLLNMLAGNVGRNRNADDA